MSEDREQSLQDRKWVAYGALLLLFLVMVYRFFQVQILDRDKFVERSDQNRIRQMIVPPPRGHVFDAKERLIVDNRAHFSVSIVPYEVRKAGNIIPEFFAKNLKKNQSDLEKKIERAGHGFKPVKLISQINFSELAIIEEQKLDLPGVVIGTEPRRFYPDGVGAAHLLGNIGEVTERQLENLDEERYQSGDIIGKDGLELFYEEELRGEKGIQYRLVDALGREIQSLNLDVQDQAPVPGNDLFLSLDLDYQKIAEDMLGDRQGSVVFIDTRNGEVLVQVSKPDYDPNFFSREFTVDEWAELRDHPGKSLINRPIAGTYPAGSTFKPVAVLAGLNENIVTPEYRRPCSGAFVLGRSVFHCFRGTVHGVLDMRQAIERSCNVYFYRLGLEIGFDAWTKYATMLGFGKPTGIDLPQEKGGIAPTDSIMEAMYGKNWTKGHMVNMVIGQGAVLVTPLQMARFSMMIGNAGTYYTPHLVRAVRDGQTGEIRETPIKEHTLSEIRPDVWSVLKDGMYNVVQGGSGTARGSKIYGLEFSGKTGTAQNEQPKDHGWFIGFAPSDTPRVSWAVIVEQGGTGGGSAAPIAKAVLQEIFKDEIELAQKQRYRAPVITKPDTTATDTTDAETSAEPVASADEQVSTVETIQ
jgi:penicillin-binding protein 2